MTRSKRSVLPFLLAATLVPALVLPPVTAQALTTESRNGGPMIKGSSKLVEQNRSIGAFSKLRLEGSFTVEAQQASGAKVSVQADDNLVDLIETAVENDTLIVRGKPNVSWRTSSPMVVKVSFTRLQGAEVRGSGDLNIQGLHAERFNASVAGSGDLRIDTALLGQLQARLAGSGDLQAKGTAQQVDVQLAGSGDVNLSQLLARQSQVKLSGSGDVSVHSTEAADVSIAGTGDVRVYGKPATVNRKIVGTGDIHVK